jgi:CRISPR/Cas system CSM-associated protein Csm2 small subunit
MTMATTNDLSKLGEMTGHKSLEKKYDSPKQHSSKNNESRGVAKPLFDDIFSFKTLEGEKLVSFINILETYIKEDESVKSLTFGQVRNIYNIIVKDADDADELHRKRPELAFVIAKQTNDKCKDAISFFLDLLKEANESNFQNIKDFTSAYLKYHKFYGKSK